MKNKYFTKEERTQLEGYLKAKMPKREIAKTMEKSLKTIYNEIKRGTIALLNSDLIEYETYCADFAQSDFLEKQKNKGTVPKVLRDQELLNLVQHKLVKERLSPDVTIGTLRKEHPEKDIPCTTSLYYAIDKGFIPGVSNKSLLVKGLKKKQAIKRVNREHKSKTRTSIEARPEEILSRNEFGHFEMDCVESCKSDNECLLVMTERMTRHSFVFRMRQKTEANVIKCLDTLERKYKHKFKKIFKTITMDNGSEFLDFKGIEKSLYTKKKRTTTYYCHPYTACERGSNENYNRFIRRFIKKGEKIADLSLHYINQVIDRINHYPRKILNYCCSAELFELELSKL
ncbi:IS30 family transposase [Eubacterium limosum]|uniref:IS30 family transposase n=1 Tax=Eubacterium limosum TaxID=1736 RepID=UPI0022E765D8|nr:IS30 family transposase [Eubacterium limosum]